MGEVFHCDFYLGDKLPYQLKTFEYTSLNGFKGKLHNHFIHHFYWQSGVIRQLFAPYRFYIMNGEPFCLSTWLFLLLSKLTNKKVIGWTHGWYGREGIIKGNIKRRFFKLFDKLLVYNDYSINLLKQQGIDKSRLFCFANSLDSDRIKTIRKQISDTDIYRSHFGNDNPVLIYCGRIQKRKRLDLLINCLERLNQEGFPTNLMMVGADDEGTGIDRLVKEKGLTDKVWSYGPCFDERLLGEFFSNATVCISPGNVGLTAIHSLSYGCPVITHGDFPYQMPEFEAIRPNITGAFFKRDDINDMTETIKKWIESYRHNRDQIRQQAYDEIDKKWNIHYQIEVLKRVLI
jgi:glycosyltransferase involved in cell wall biosynthesis